MKKFLIVILSAVAVVAGAVTVFQLTRTDPLVGRWGNTRNSFEFFADGTVTMGGGGGGSAGKWSRQRDGRVKIEATERGNLIVIVLEEVVVNKDVLTMRFFRPDGTPVEEIFERNYTGADVAAMRRETKAQLEILKLGLEKYKHTFGEYPRPKTPRSGDAKTGWGEDALRLNGAQVLYQALSGDGTSELDLGGPDGFASDGKIDEFEIENMILDEVAPENSSQMVGRSQGIFLLVDGFGNPWQYRHGDEANAINATYDLWSYGSAEVFDDDDTGNVRWIRNW